MSSNSAILRRDEEYVLGLRRLYDAYGYKKFKMSKFEKYDLYLENKSFLRNGNIVTVTDPKGRLLALKPDITLSIVKNIRAIDLPQKLYYCENVYIADTEAGEIKETTQVGLEYFGDVDIRSLAEILILAAHSLEEAGEDYRIAISHMGFVSDILDAAKVDEVAREQLSKFIAEKNLHGLMELCSRYSIDSVITAKLCGLIDVSGKLSSVVKTAESLVLGESSKSSYAELVALSKIIDTFGISDKFILDFSVMNDMNYYNGLVFQGFINGVPKTVLSGGQYDNLLKRFGLNTSAVGFAVSTDLLDNFNYRPDEYDCDVMILYSDECDPAIVLKVESDFVSAGKKCLALSSMPDREVKYKSKVIISSDGSMKNE